MLVEQLIDDDWIARLTALAVAFLECSRAVADPGDMFDLAPNHGPERPMLRRLKMPDQHHAEFWSYASGVIADVAADPVGPDVVFHHSKLNFRWPDGGDEVK